LAITDSRVTIVHVKQQQQHVTYGKQLAQMKVSYNSSKYVKLVAENITEHKADAFESKK